jgi:catechol 2,3-dioxygenase-like lactoylglutathione lyase family enzyme
MELGAFSISLTVKDLAVSQAFYEKLGFEATGGSHEAKYLILKNGTTLIGLFEGMFDRNILTFNPGLANTTERLTDYTDIRKLQRELKARGLEPITEADQESSGPASLTLEDPDGNPILIDQFF